MKINWTKTLLFTGVILFIAGMIDPLEGSIIIAIGSLMITIYSYLVNDQLKRYFILAFVFLLLGILSMFYISSLGGIGEGALSKFWLISIAPYPIGWLMTIVLLIYKKMKKGFGF